MPLYTEILTSTKSAAGAWDERQYFTVNNAVNYVTVPAYAGFPSGRLRAANNTYIFNPKDSLRILAIGIYLPYSYTFAPPIPMLHLAWVDGTTPAHYDDFAQIGPAFTNLNTNSSYLYVPFENAEFSVDIPCTPPPTFVTPYIVANFQLLNDADRDTNISMVGSPAVLNQAVLPICPFIKLQHFLLLT